MSKIGWLTVIMLISFAIANHFDWVKLNWHITVNGKKAYKDISSYVDSHLDNSSK